MQTYAGTTAWVFGGSQGIGRALALQLTQAGAHVLILARNEAPLNETLQAMQLLAQADQQLAMARVDVTDDQQVQTCVAEQSQAFGPPNLVITCVGAAFPDHFRHINAEQFERCLKLNLFGVRHVAAAVTPHMKAGSQLVATASMAGLIPVYGYSDYSAAKAGVIAFCEVLRAELRPQGVAVSVLCPPDTRTPGFEQENRNKPAETVALSAGTGILAADAVAHALLRGVQRGQFLIIPGWESRLAAALWRRAPGLLRAWMDHVIAKTQKARPD